MSFKRCISIAFIVMFFTFSISMIIEIVKDYISEKIYPSYTVDSFFIIVAVVFLLLLFFMGFIAGLFFKDGNK